MTYFGFLLVFLCIPLLVMSLLTLRDQRTGRISLLTGDPCSVVFAIGLHILLAVVYTTPWDNYLVASGVWYYDPHLVTGVVLGWVPIEEYTFFVLQAAFAGLWWWFLARRQAPATDFRPSTNIRHTALGIVALAWGASLGLLISGWKPATYFVLESVWALIPIGIQLFFGADILWYRRRLVALTILPLTAYLSLTDALAIGAGTWTIAPGQSFNLFVGALPIEELIFFLFTNTLLAFGITLLLAPESRARLAQIRGRLGYTQLGLSLPK
jgi:lycopene cyclase domain-containing protein